MERERGMYGYVLAQIERLRPGEVSVGLTPMENIINSRDPRLCAHGVVFVAFSFVF